MRFSLTALPRCSALAALLSLFALGTSLSPAPVNAAPAGPKYRIEDLSMAGYVVTQAVGLNNKGEVALNAWTSFFTEVNPSIYRGGSLTSVADRFRFLEGINDRGDLIGEGLNRNRASLWRDGQMIDLRTTFFGTTAVDGVAVAINNKGQVTGAMQSSFSQPGQVFVYDGTSSRYLELPANRGATAWDINEHGAVAGQFEPDRSDFFDGEYLGFVHDGTRATVLPTLGGKQGYAYGINDAGQAVGYAFTNDDAVIGGYLYSGGTLSPLGVDIARDINNRGWIVGTDARNAFLYRGGQVHYLADLLVGDNATRWSLYDATAINERGQIIGYGFADGRDRPFLATPVPEPSVWALMLVGFGVVGRVAWQRRT